MSRYQHSKSGLFLMELIFNILLFSILCGCGLMFFTKAYNLSKDTTTLHNAVRITSSIAAIYESGDGSLALISREFEHAAQEDDLLHIYFDKEYNPCSKSDSVYYVSIRQSDSFEPSKICIDFFNHKKELAYSISACNYTPYTPSSEKEVSVP